MLSRRCFLVCSGVVVRSRISRISIYRSVEAVFEVMARYTAVRGSSVPIFSRVGR